MGSNISAWDEQAPGLGAVYGPFDGDLLTNLIKPLMGHNKARTDQRTNKKP